MMVERAVALHGEALVAMFDAARPGHGKALGVGIVPGAAGFVGDFAGGFVRRRDERLIVGRTDKEQVGIELFFRWKGKFIDERAKFANRLRLYAV